MRLHILGVCGTFMSGIAIIARQCGHEVTGSDMNVYPPMSTQLKEQGITLLEGYEPTHIDPKVDCVIVGNVVSRGNKAMEYIMANRIPYVSGPEWLAKNVLQSRHVLAVSGTHGKTTTTSMLTWLLESAGLQPGFLIGGVAENFGVSARLGNAPYFVIEADEYDSAFFDKRSKFLHYRPTTLILNNLEYDHADIFPDLDAIKKQFHYLIRTVPNNGMIVKNAIDINLSDVIDMGCWTPQTSFGLGGEWMAKLKQADGSEFSVLRQDKLVGDVKWGLVGEHNVSNALAAIAAATQAGVAAELAISSLSGFKNVKRRLETRGVIKDIVIYDDFAHHPTAISTTLAGLRARVGKNRIIAVIEFGSYTMRAGVHKNKIQEALKEADMVICKDTNSDWGLNSILAQFKQPTKLYPDVDSLVRHLLPELKAGDHVVVMSNSGFGGIHQKLLDSLEKQEVGYESESAQRSRSGSD